MKFAPLNVPLNRRWQTTMTGSFYTYYLRFMLVINFFHVAFSILFGPLCVGVTIYYLFFASNSYFKYALVAFIMWELLIDDSQSKGGRPISLFINLPFWNAFRDYFPASLIITEKLEAKKKYLFCLHPHGIIGMSMWPTLFMGCEKARERLGIDYRICTVSVNFKIPIWREWILSFGFIDAKKESIQYAFSKGSSVCLVVGGAREALLSKPGELQLTLNKRKGFVKQALVNGANLVPVFSFGETDLYTTYVLQPGSFLHKMQIRFMNTFGFSTPIFSGRGIFNYNVGILPHRHACYTVIGNAIDVPLIKEPTDEEIDKYHALYIIKIKELYEANVEKYGDKNTKLIIAE